MNRYWVNTEAPISTAPDIVEVSSPCSQTVPATVVAVSKVLTLWRPQTPFVLWSSYPRWFFVLLSFPSDIIRCLFPDIPGVSNYFAQETKGAHDGGSAVFVGSCCCQAVLRKCPSYASVKWWQPSFLEISDILHWLDNTENDVNGHKIWAGFQNFAKTTWFRRFNASAYSISTLLSVVDPGGPHRRFWNFVTFKVASHVTVIWWQKGNCGQISWLKTILPPVISWASGLLPTFTATWGQMAV